MSNQNATLIQKIKALTLHNKSMTCIHTHGKSIEIEIINGGYHNKIDLQHPLAESYLTACHLTLDDYFNNPKPQKEAVKESVAPKKDFSRDYTVEFQPKNKKMFFLQYDVRAIGPNQAIEEATKQLVSEGIKRHEYKAKPVVKLDRSDRSAA